MKRLRAAWLAFRNPHSFAFIMEFGDMNCGEVKKGGHTIGSIDSFTLTSESDASGQRTTLALQSPDLEIGDIVSVQRAPGWPEWGAGK